MIEFSHHIRDIETQGFTAIPDVLKTDDLEFLCAEMDNIYAAYDPERDGPGVPEGFNFVGNLVDKHPFFHTLFLRATIYDIMCHFIGDDCILSSLNSLEPLKGWGNQFLHRDNSDVPVDERTPALNSLWVIDGMDSNNGATRVLPGSHLNDLPAPEDEKEVVQVQASPGTVVVIDARLLHGASANHSGRRRRLLHGYYIQRGVKQQTEQKKVLSSETKAALTPEARWVLALDD